MDYVDKYQQIAIDFKLYPEKSFNAYIISCEGRSKALSGSS